MRDSGKKVATYVVAWIEIDPCHLLTDGIRVATYVVAWIEILGVAAPGVSYSVATYVVAWIEIRHGFLILIRSTRRHLCSGVD